MPADRREYWRKREQTPARKAYQRKYRKEYMKEYRKTHPSKLKKEVENRKKLRRINKAKLVKLKGGKCEICGYDKCIAALDFHHSNPKEKECKFNTNASLKRMIIEVRKCKLVCANCHREIHYKQQLWVVG